MGRPEVLRGWMDDLSVHAAGVHFAYEHLVAQLKALSAHELQGQSLAQSGALTDAERAAFHNIRGKVRAQLGRNLASVVDRSDVAAGGPPVDLHEMVKHAIAMTLAQPAFQEGGN